MESAPDEGTEFRILLPRSDRGDERAPTDAAPPLRSARTASILIVEDEPAVRAVAVRTLRGGGHRVTAAESGEEAIAWAATGAHIDVLITDVVMPGLGGAKLATAIAESRPGLRVIFTSGYTADDVLRQGVRSDTITFLPKPFTPDALLRLVGDVLDRAPGPV